MFGYRHKSNMKYELAKELKDAGFPQTAKKIRIPYEGKEDEYRYLSFPTLSELIEACGMSFRSLNLHSDGHWDTFTARSSTIHPQHFHAATPEEAVARLWLALNKK